MHRCSDGSVASSRSVASFDGLERARLFNRDGPPPGADRFQRAEPLNRTPLRENRIDYEMAEQLTRGRDKQ